MNFSGKKVLDSDQFGNSEEEGMSSQVDNNKWMRNIKEKRIDFWKPMQREDGREG